MGVLMTIKQAKKVLGKDVGNLTDEELLEEIKLAAMFKDLFFSQTIKDRKSTS